MLECIQDMIRERIHECLVCVVGTRRESFLFEEENIGEMMIHLQILI